MAWAILLSAILVFLFCDIYKYLVGFVLEWKWDQILGFFCCFFFLIYVKTGILPFLKTEQKEPQKTVKVSSAKPNWLELCDSN